jgi:hypothetical protein
MASNPVPSRHHSTSLVRLTALVGLLGLTLVAFAACGGDDGCHRCDDTSASDALLETANDVPELSEGLSEGLPEIHTDASPELTDSAEALDGPDLPEQSESSDTATTAVPLPGFGDLTGACGALDEDTWTSAAPAFFVNHLDFGDDPYDEADYELLSPGGQKILDDGNAGGNSIMSELFAYEALQRCELAELLKTETEILYTDEGGKITDLLVWLDERQIGVSVTRAVGWPQDAPYTTEQASELLAKKLQGVLDSSANVAAADAWTRQILHVLAYGDEHATSLEAAWEALDLGLRANTLVIVTVTDGDDGFVY